MASQLAQPFPVGMPAASDVLVWVVDDDESIRLSLTRLFRSARLPAIALASARSYLEQPPHGGPACLVLDVQMPGLDGLELQEALRGRAEQIVFLSGHGDVPKCAQAMKGGAVDFLTKPVDDRALLGAVRRALERSRELRQRAVERAAARSGLERLTPREFEVMRHVITGALNKQIANKLGAAEKTIKIHRGQVMQKMGVASVAELVRLAQTAGVAPA